MDEETIELLNSLNLGTNKIKLGDKIAARFKALEDQVEDLESRVTTLEP